MGQSASKIAADIAAGGGGGADNILVTIHATYTIFDIAIPGGAALKLNSGGTALCAAANGGACLATPLTEIVPVANDAGTHALYTRKTAPFGGLYQDSINGNIGVETSSGRHLATNYSAGCSADGVNFVAVNFNAASNRFEANTGVGDKTWTTSAKKSFWYEIA